MGHADRYNPDFMHLASLVIAQPAIGPRALAACDLPGFALLTPAIQQLLALLPEQHKAQLSREQHSEPRATRNVTIEDLVHLEQAQPVQAWDADWPVRPVD